jgi:hypothetical protein
MDRKTIDLALLIAPTARMLSLPFLNDRSLTNQKLSFNEPLQPLNSTTLNAARIYLSKFHNKI